MTTHSPWYRRTWSKRYALPPEHGAWAWWLGPLVVGAAAGGHVGADLLILLVAAFVAFAERHAATVVAKVVGGRRSRIDLAPAAAWLTLYLIVLAATLAMLVARGHGQLLWLGAVAAPVMLWYLWLMLRRAERGELKLDLAAAGALALTAPAAYWTCSGDEPLTPWILWGVCFAQSAASIVHVSVRLRQMRLKTGLTLAESWRIGIGPLAFHCGNTLAAGVLATGGLLSWLVVAGFALTLADGVYAVLRPPVGVKPVQIGLRQLAVTTAFMLLAALGYAL